MQRPETIKVNVSESSVTVSLASGKVDRSYPIYIDKDLLSNAQLLGSLLGERSVCLVTNDTLSELYLDRVRAALGADRNVSVVILPDGEQYKTLTAYDQVLTAALEKKHERSTVFIALGGGVVGENAAIIATGMRSKVYVVDKSKDRLKQLHEMFGDKIIPTDSEKTDLNKLVSECDLLVGGVLIPGAEAPKLITKEMIKKMKRGSVVVDVAIDQGGCVETSKPTTHANPTFLVDDVVHYCVANMPGGVPRTSTMALNKATLPLLVELADNGCKKTLQKNKNYLAGLNVYKGKVTFKGVAEAFKLNYTPPDKALEEAN